VFQAVGPTELKLRPDLTEAIVLPTLNLALALWLQNGHYWRHFWPQKPEIMPVLGKVGKSS
jgi:hypothetical protein